MAAFQLLKSTLSPISASHTNFPAKSCWFISDSDFRKKKLTMQSRFRSSSCFYYSKSFKVRCAAQEADNQTNGEEPPESLFMKELKRRGMTPTSLLEDTNRSDFENSGEMREEDRGFSRNAVSTEIDEGLSNQRERSLLLNSEGLEGLIPRARLLLTIGGTFFLGFWPLILITVAFFIALYFYLGPAFVLDACKMPISPPHYIDTYALLEDERISQIAPRVN